VNTFQACARRSGTAREIGARIRGTAVELFRLRPPVLIGAAIRAPTERGPGGRTWRNDVVAHQRSERVANAVQAKLILRLALKVRRVADAVVAKYKALLTRGVRSRMANPVSSENEIVWARGEGEAGKQHRGERYGD